MRVAHNPSKDRAEERAEERDDLVDAEVPAAVVCALCGEADCAGCRDEPTRSGVVAIVPWERPGAPVPTRLWATARAATFDAERFFEALPDGPIAPAVRFAVASEMIASGSMTLLATIPIAIVFPGWVRHLLVDSPLTATRLVAAAIPGLAAILILAHVAHGWALDHGARRSGARGATTRAVRFGLYATGWDLVIGPLGAGVVVAKDGWRKALSAAGRGVGLGLPDRSARAFLRGCYRLDGAAARPALRASHVAAGIATVVGAIAVLGAMAAAFLL